MPAKDFTSVSIPEDFYVEVKFYDRNEKELKKRRIRSFSQLVQQALLDFKASLEDDLAEAPVGHSL